MQENEISKEKLLVALLVKGNEDAFKKLFLIYEKSVMLYALKLTHSREASEELVQDIFIKIWEYRSKIDPNKPFEALLFKIAKNHILNYLRDLKKEHTWSVNDETFQQIAISESGQPDHLLIRKEYTHHLEHIIHQLPAKRQKIFIMNKLEGFSYAEIAQELGISKDTVRLQLIQSMKFIKKNYAMEFTLITWLFNIYTFFLFFLIFE